MQYTDMIVNEIRFLPVEKQAEILDFVIFLKQKTDNPSIEKNKAEDVENALRSFNVDVSQYQFDRLDANAR